MALNNFGMGFQFTAEDQASAQMAGINQQMTGMTRNTSLAATAMRGAAVGLGAAVGTMAAGAGVLAGLFGLANQAGEFERGLAGVGAVSRATSQEMDALRTSAINAGIATQFSPDEAVEGLLSLATAGQTAQQATQTLIPVLDLAAGSLGQLGVGQAAAAVVGTLNAYGMAATDATEVTDKLLRITQLTNFQARDFEVGLAKAAAAGAIFGTSLEDVLITVGQLRNRNIEASSAATAMREVLRRLASDSGAQAAVRKAGVDVFDEETGKMRSAVDILLDLKDATASMTDEDRNAIVVKATGARGLLAFSAIQTASFTTMREGRQVTLEGRDAIKALREEMANASGTAESFRETLLDTFEGQKTLLAGTVQTLGVVFGEPAARVFKPLVDVITNGLNIVIRLFNAIPKPAQTALVGIAASAGIAMMAFGGMMASAFTIVLLLPILKGLALAMGAIAIAAAPVIAAAGAVAIAVGAMVVAVKRDVGGLGETFTKFVSDAKLAFEGLVALFSEGKISGPLAEELSKAENEGVLGFISTIYAAGYRIQRFLEGVREGFGAFMDQAGPTLERLGSAVLGLAAAFGFVGDSVQAFAGAPSEEANQSGRAMGEMFGRIAENVIDAITAVVEFTTRAVEWGKSFWADVGPGLTEFGGKVWDLGAGLLEVAGIFWDTVSPFMDVLGTMFGFLVAQIFDGFAVMGGGANAFAGDTGGLIGTLKIFAGVLGWVFNVISIVASAFMAFAGAVVWVLNRLKELVLFVTTGPFRLMTAALEGLGIIGDGAEGTTKRTTMALAEEKPIMSVPAAPGAFPAVAEAANMSQERGEMMSTLQSSLAAMSSQQQGPQEIVIHSNMSIEEEVLASSVERVSRDRNASEFRRVSYGEEG